MGKRTNGALIFTIIATILFVACLASPWWYTTLEDRSPKWTSCFIDGTCRNGNYIYKNNGDAQTWYDTTLAMMIIALAVFIAHWHFVWFVWSPRYRDYPLRKKSWVVATGAITVVLILIAVTTFAVQVPKKYGFSSTYGSKQVGDKEFTWGLHFGWFLAVMTMIPVVTATVLIAAKKATEEGLYQRITKEPQASYHTIRISSSTPPGSA